MPWWLDLDPYGVHWSATERHARALIFVVSAVPLSGICSVEMWLLGHFFSYKPINALIALLIGAPVAFWIGRRICGCFWPNFMHRADENAAKQLAVRGY
jgi:hypothetical protein